MTPAQLVALDAMRSAWPEEVVQRMLRAESKDIETEAREEGERAGRSYWMTGVTQVLDPADRLRLTEDEIFAALEDLARPTERRNAATQYATRARR